MEREHVFIVAEVGINHNGDLNLAKKLIDWAVLAGCDAVKFQKRTVDKVYTKEYLDGIGKAHGELHRGHRRKGWSLGRQSMTRLTDTVRKKELNCMRLLGILIPSGFCSNMTANIIRWLQPC